MKTSSPVTRSGRFTRGPAAEVTAFTESVSFDWRLWRQDIRGSVAHASMLRAIGVLTASEHRALVRGLRQIGREIADGKFNMEPRFKDAPKTSAELADWYTRNMARAAERVGARGAKQLTTPVDFYGAFNLPNAMYLTFLNNHSIHHRGQLATYLRPMGSKVPSIYGGSADEPFQMPATA